MIAIRLIKSELNNGIRLTRYYDHYRWYDGENLDSAIKEFKKRTGHDNYTIE